MLSAILLSFLLINCVMAKFDLAKEEKEIDKFAKGEYPNAADVMTKHSIQLSEDIYDSIFEDMEAVRKNEQDKYPALIKSFHQFIENILKMLKEKVKPTTELAKVYESFVTKLVEVGHKKLEQVKATTEGKDVKHFSKDNFMDDVKQVAKNGNEKCNKILKEKNKGGLKDSEGFINVIKSALPELAHIHVNKDCKIEKTLIDGITVLSKQFIAFMEHFHEEMKKF